MLPRQPYLCVYAIDLSSIILYIVIIHQFNFASAEETGEFKEND